MKNRIITIIFAIYVLSFSIFSTVLKNEEFSISERRKLKKFPEFSLTSDYIANVDKYLLDHFPLRDTFRSIKANYNYNILNMLDNNKIYLKDGYIFKSEYPTNKDSINNFINITTKNLSNLNENNNVFIMIIPDKNYYLNDKYFLNIDYDYIYNEINKLNIQNIDIRETMELNDYYKTDTHWRQEKLTKVVKKLGEVMNFKLEEEIFTKNIYNNFYGVYYGEAALRNEPDKIIYLTSESINNAQVKYLENDKLKTVYNKNNLESFDSYGVYLDGASSFIEIYNEFSNSDRELIIFRDSFGSSLVPLLINSYKKITLIDNRYINSDYYLKYIDFTNQDVLFLYSTLIINNSVTLKG